MELYICIYIFGKKNDLSIVVTVREREEREEKRNDEMRGN